MVRVTIGLPVYNGDRHLEVCLDSILSQDFSDFELVISNNASTDRTDAICRHYAKRDRRVRYIRQQTNHGAAANYNFVFREGRGTYFKWAAHDDVLRPQYLSKCVAVLDRDPSVLVCTTRTQVIDDVGNVKAVIDGIGDLDHSSTARRFNQVLKHHIHFVQPIFGVIRKSGLDGTDLIAPYGSSDRTLLTHLALRGRIVVLPEYQFQYRMHQSQSISSHKSLHDYATWFDPSAKIKYPHWKLFHEYAKLLSVEEVPACQRMVCYLSVAREMARSRNKLFGNLLHPIFSGHRKV
jgi:glycosyltransferase involved in cell wall biosynthesis